MNWNGPGRKWSCPNLIHYIGICLEGLSLKLALEQICSVSHGSWVHITVSVLVGLTNTTNSKYHIPNSQPELSTHTYKRFS